MARGRAANADVSIDLLQTDVRTFTSFAGLVVDFLSALISLWSVTIEIRPVEQDLFSEGLHAKGILMRLLAPLDVELQRFERAVAPGEPLIVDAVAWTTMPKGGGEGS